MIDHGEVEGLVEFVKLHLANPPTDLRGAMEESLLEAESHAEGLYRRLTSIPEGEAIEELEDMLRKLCIARFTEAALSQYATE